MNFLELKIPPPIVALLVGLSMWLTNRYTPAFTFITPWHAALAIGMAGAGGLFALAAIVSFFKAKTTVNPHRPKATSAMVTSGVYQVSRNPMYLGVLLVLSGWAIWLSNLLAIALLAAFVAYISRFQILPEERILHAKFGSEFTAYKASVRRWL